jgi:hypothetical protein
VSDRNLVRLCSVGSSSGSANRQYAGWGNHFFRLKYLFGLSLKDYNIVLLLSAITSNIYSKIRQTELNNKLRYVRNETTEA